jgi:hypothetical protein
MNKITPPALALGDQQLQPGLVDPAGPDEAFHLPDLGLLLGGVRIGFDDLSC